MPTPQKIHSTYLPDLFERTGGNMYLDNDYSVEVENMSKGAFQPFCPCIKPQPNTLLFFKVFTIKYSITKTVKLLQSCNQLIAQQTLLLVKKMFVLALVWTQVLFHAAMIPTN